MGRDRRRRGARVVLAAALFLAITPVLTASAVQADASAELPALPSIPTLDFASASLSQGGRAFLQGASLTDATRHALTATIDPATGKVDGRVRAEVPRPEQGDLHFRMLAGLPALHTGLELKDVTVGGKPTQAKRDRALATVPVPPKASGGKVVVGMRFSYRAPRAGTTHGRPLT